MNKPKHTPGPWMIAESNRAVYTEAPLSKQRTYIAELITNGDDNKNATLIAAAPDLLTVAENIQRLLKAMTTNANLRNEFHYGSFEECYQLDQAIAKARGEL